MEGVLNALEASALASTLRVSRWGYAALSASHILALAMLVGASSDDGDGASMRWTGHHNWYDDVVQRLPFIRFGRAHSYNNLIEWRSGTAMSVRLGSSQLLVENNILAPQTNVGHKVISEDENDVGPLFTRF